jgi:Protein of unknown function (DUF2510)
MQPALVAEPATTAKPEGWYPDPRGAHLRWWDGGDWTERTAALGPSMHLDDWDPLDLAASSPRARRPASVIAAPLAWLAAHSARGAVRH